MKKILIITGSDNSISHGKFLLNFQKYSDASVEDTHFSNLEFSIIDNKSNVYDQKNKSDLDKYDMVIFRSWKNHFINEAISCASYLELHKVDFFDKEPLFTGCSSKLTQFFIINRNNLSILIDSIYISNNQSYPEIISKYNLTFPLILKDINGFQGESNYLVHDLESLNKILSENQDVRFIVQKYIENDFDFRFLIFNKKVMCSYKRIRKNKTDHRNHAKFGAKEQQVPLDYFDKKTVSDIIKTTSLLNRNLAAVDFIYDKETHKTNLLEVNPSPGFTYDLDLLPEFKNLVENINVSINSKINFA